MALHSNDISPTVAYSIAGVRFFKIGKLYHFSCKHLPKLRVGDFVIVETTRGQQLGQVMNLLTSDQASPKLNYKPIVRKATPADMLNQQTWQTREADALITCREKAAHFNELKTAKFEAAQYNFNGTLLTFILSAEDKLNTSKLRSALQRSFKAKVELRQVGPRDIAKFIGGLGACGIQRCCSVFLTDFSPISIKMAKAQGISLNPAEITGTCGRLRCCLVYEYEQYVAARKHLPRRNKRIGTPYGEGKVISVHPLQDSVTVIINDTRHTIERQDIIPLAEWEALQAQAATHCAKHGDTPCDCATRGVETKTSAPVKPSAEASPSDSQSPEKTEGKSKEKQGRSGARRGRNRRRRRRRPRGKRADKTSKIDKNDTGTRNND